MPDDPTLEGSTMPEFDTPDPISATIELVVGDVTLVASDRRDTVVDVLPEDPASAVDVRAAERVAVEFVDGRLGVVTRDKWRQYSPLPRRFGSVSAVIRLPAGSAVRVRLGMGDLSADGSLASCDVVTGTGHVRLDRTGPLRLKTATGTATVDLIDGHADVVAAGKIRIGEVRGHARIKNLVGDTWIGHVAGHLRCRAAAGDIAVEQADCDVDARSASGDVRIREVVQGAVSLVTSSGDLEVGIRPGTAAHLDVRSQAGRVRNELTATEAPEPAAHTVEVFARTPAGDVVVRRSRPSSDS
ncbi:MAG: DUF4097 domain-containing protein [Kineosporiaceae bacterium]